MKHSRSGRATACRRDQWAVLTSLLLVLTAAAGWLWAHEGHTPLPTRGAQVDVARGQVILSREAREALDVQTAAVETRPVEERLLAYAALAAPWQQHAFVTSRLPGRIAKLHARPGQTVAAGQPLAEVESVELESLQLELLNAQNDVQLSTRVVAGMEEAAPQGAIPEASLLEARKKHQTNLNALEVARSKWGILGLSADLLTDLLREKKPLAPTLTVRTPIRGTVIHADLAVGKVVEPAEHLFEVVDLTTVWVQINVLEQDMHRLAVGQPMELRLTAYPNEVFKGAVQVKGFYLDPQTHLATAWSALSNPPGEEPGLLPGMSGEARLLLPGPAAGTAVPAEALVNDGMERYVLVEEAGTAGGSQYQKRNVVVGRQGRDWVEVHSGDLFPGDRVVTRGVHELAGFFAPGVLRPSPEASRNLGLKVELVRPEVVEDVIEIDGAVDVPPERRALVSTPLAGAILKLHVDRGQQVRAGDVVAEVVSTELHGLQLDLLRAHLDGELLESVWDRLRKLPQSGVVPRRTLLEVESQVNASRQQRDTLQRKLRALGLSAEQLKGLLAEKKLVEALPVRCPIDGVVVHFDRVLGQAVKADEALLTVHDLSRPWIQGYVSERDLGQVRLGQKVRVRLTADPDFLADGVVVRSGRVFGVTDRTLSVWIELERPPAAPLRHGQLARLTLSLRRPPPTLAAPLSAVWRKGAQAFVFVQGVDGAFDRRAVVTGRSDDRRVEITLGLLPGERVVVQGAEGLRTAYAVIR
jgi:membrane fusion protein, heavy metal efflux system